VTITGRSLLILSLTLAAVTAFAGQGKLYWTDTLTDKIQRANLDGSGIEDILSINDPAVLQLDVDGGRMYWVSTYPAEGLYRVHRAGLNGSNLETIHEVTNPVAGIALNPLAGKLYYAVHDCPGNSKIFRSELDGSMVEEIVTGQDRVGRIAIDVADDRMLWAGGDECSQDDPGYNAQIYRATLEGQDIQSFIVYGTGAGELDTAQNVVYWVSITDCEPCSSYHRANYDGSNDETLIVDWYGSSGLGLDFLAGKMYFGSQQWIWRANLDGTNLIELIDGLGWVTGVALDSPDEDVPAASPAGVLAAVLLLLTSATFLLRHRRRQPPVPSIH